MSPASQLMKPDLTRTNILLWATRLCLLPQVLPLLVMSSREGRRLALPFLGYMTLFHIYTKTYSIGLL